MDINQWIEAQLPSGEMLEHRFDRLWPICRSLTGQGVRETFAQLREAIPLELVEVPSGTKVFDWTVPQEWNLRDAYLEDENGRRWIDFKANNLHVVGYSIPVDQTLSLEELQPHLHSLPEQPNAIPYLTSYNEPRWGFCLSDTVRGQLPKGRFRAVIDSTLAPGSLTYGHLVLPATEGGAREVLISTYICHPSLANNELSGPLVATAIYEALSRLPRRKFNYRFVFVPETVGAITYLANHGEKLKKNCVAGLVVTCCGDDKNITYKKSRRGNTEIDRCVTQVLLAHRHETAKPFQIFDFFPTGSDERQYCSPGFNLPVGSLMRSMYGLYPEYHTSLDNKDFISFKAMRETVGLYLHSLLSFECNATYISTVQNGEPMLRKHGLYLGLGSQKQNDDLISKILYLLNYSDGTNDLLSIAERAGTSVTQLVPLAEQLLEKKLLLRPQSPPAENEL